MFEGWILSLLNKVLGEYVKEHCLARDRLKADVYNGHICLERLELRETAFDFLNLPITLLKGYIGQVEVKISGGSWTNIMSKPVELWLDNIHILVGRKVDWNEEERAQREQQIKQALLRRAELFARHHDGNAHDESGEGSFLDSLLTKMVDNLEFHVRNVHIRYQDHDSYVRHPFACGVTLNALHCKSTNEHYQETYVNRVEDSEAQRAIFKLFQMSQFSVYCNMIQDDDPLRGVNIETVSYERWQEIFATHIAKDDGHLTSSNTTLSSSMSSSTNGSSSLNADCCDEPQPTMHYLVKPLDIDMKLRVNRDPFDLSSPRLRVQCNIDRVALMLEKQQYRSVLFLAAGFDNQQKRDRYRTHRPNCSVRQDARAWWQYAINAVNMDLKEERHRWTPEYFHKRRRDRMEYCLLWKRKRAGNTVFEEDDDNNGMYRPLTEYDTGRLERLEYQLNSEDIIFFRSLAERDLRQTKTVRETILKRELKKQTERSTMGVVSWLFGMVEEKESED